MLSLELEMLMGTVFGESFLWRAFQQFQMQIRFASNMKTNEMFC